MKGSAYYAAVKNKVRYDKEAKTYEPIDDGTVWGVVFSHLLKKKAHNLSKLAIGTEIIWTRIDGTTVELVKHAPAYQFEIPFWFNAADCSYVPAKRIQNWEIKAE